MHLRVSRIDEVHLVSIERVARLRRAAERARELLLDHHDTGPEREQSHGWFATAYDANESVNVLDTLQLKAGFALRAYEYRSGPHGNGFMWAVPIENRLLAPEERPSVEDTGLSRPKPPGAIPLMRAIEGDGSPRSYLSASILHREAAEFGACWHGCFWSPQTILSGLPRQTDEPDVSDDEQKLAFDVPLGEWTWHSAVPSTWEPAYAETGKTRKVVLHVHDPAGEDHICRATDIYRADSYDCTTKSNVLCTGDSGVIF